MAGTQRRRLEQPLRLRGGNLPLEPRAAVLEFGIRANLLRAHRALERHEKILLLVLVILRELFQCLGAEGVPGIREIAPYDQRFARSIELSLKLTTLNGSNGLESVAVRVIAAV